MQPLMHIIESFLSDLNLSLFIPCFYFKFFFQLLVSTYLFVPVLTPLTPRSLS